MGTIWNTHLSPWELTRFLHHLSSEQLDSEHWHGDPGSLSTDCTVPTPCTTTHSLIASEVHFPWITCAQTHLFNKERGTLLKQGSVSYSLRVLHLFPNHNYLHALCSKFSPNSFQASSQYIPWLPLCWCLCVSPYMLKGGWVIYFYRIN